MCDTDEFAQRQAAIRRQFGDLYDFLLALLHEVDPAGMGSDINPYEYDLEVDTILLRLRPGQTVDDLQKIIQEELADWFGLDIASSATSCVVIAHRLRAELDRRRLC